MALINNEEGAKRLARVILSDIELYSRERPNEGESLESQIEDGRRLFGTRVAPDLVPLFASVLADRQASAAGKTPAVMPVPPARAAEITTPGGQVEVPATLAPPLAAADPTPIPQVEAAPVVTQASLPPAARPTARMSAVPQPTPRPRPIARVSRAQPKAAPETTVAASAVDDEITTPGPLPSIVAPPAPVSVELGEHEGLRPVRRQPVLAGQATPPPLPAAERKSPREATSRRRQTSRTPVAGLPVVPAPVLTSTVPAMVSPRLAAETVAAPAPDSGVPVLTSRISIWRMTAVVAATASAIAVLYRFAP